MSTKVFLCIFCVCALHAQSVIAQSVIAIDNVTLIDGSGRPAKANSCVLVSGNRIARVGACPMDAPAGAQRLDGRNKFLIPGLMDIHVHLRRDNGGVRALHSYLYSGVTTILDVGNQSDFIFPLRDKQRSGEVTGTRLLVCGPIVTYPGSHGGGPQATLIDSWPSSKPVLDAHLAMKPDMLKLTYDEHGWGIRPKITLLPLDLMERIVEDANDHGIRTTAHISSETRAREAIFAGIDTLAHPIIQGAVSDSFVQLMKARQIPMASTLTIGDNYSRLAEHPEFLDQPLYRETMEAAEIQRLKTEQSAREKENRWAWWMKVMTPVCQENLHKISAAGGIVSLGTDQSSGPAVHRELELLVGGGIPPLEAIRIATLNAARFLARDRDMGSIEEGKIADMVLLSADPLADINNAKKIHTVIQDGKIIDRSKLDLPVNKK